MRLVALSPSSRQRSEAPVITNEDQLWATKAHLERFEAAAINLEERVGSDERTKLQQLEIDAVRAQADDLRRELREYEQLRDG